MKTIVSRISLIIGMLVMFQSMWAQNAVIRGNVYDKETGEPIIGCNVVIEGTNYGAVTDLDGFYTITDLEAGTHRVVASYIGYDEAEAIVQVGSASIKYQALYLTQGGVNIGVVNISAAKQEAKTDVKISKLRVSQRDIKVLPAVGGEPDIVQYLQILPGVVSTGDQGGQLFIRGGSPVQNKILLDGVTIYNPFHSIGFTSVFETEVIKNVDVFTGGFNAEHGGRISAIVDIKTRDANKVRPSGFVSASPLAVKGMIEAPLKKFKEGGGSSSVLFTAKKSIIDETSKVLYGYATGNDSIGLPFGFQDFYGKLSFGTGNGSSIDVVGFNFSDSFNNPNIANIGWGNTGFATNFNLIPKNSNIIFKGSVLYSDYGIAYRENNQGDRNSKIRELGVNLDFAVFGNDSEIKYGIDLRSIRTSFDFINDFKFKFEDRQNTAELSGYLKYKKIIRERLIIEPSVRLMYYASLGVFSPEPRLGIKFNASDRIRFKAAGGFYTQNILSTTNERDVVNLFAGFLSGPERSIKSGGETLSNNLQKSRHAIAGLEYDILENLTVNVEGYLKDFPQLIAVNRNKQETTDSDYIAEKGRAYGIDLSMKYVTDRLYVWSTYSYGHVNRDDGEQVYATLFDRRHNVNFLTSYNLGPNKDWKLSARWNFGSGFPFTQTQGYYHKFKFDDGVATDVETKNSKDIGILYSTVRNGGRLPYYHRLDLSMTKEFKIAKYLAAEVILGVTNVYNRKNIFYFDRLEYDRVDQLPILPSASVKFKF